MVGVISYNAGNVGSMLKMIEYVGGTCMLVESRDDFSKCDRLILPGVGHFNYGMRSLKSTGFLDELNADVIVRKKPIMGVCLGAQLFTKRSDEGEEPGLGWLDADTVKFDLDNKSLKIPHMGWNTITKQAEHPLLEGLDDSSHFYFVHKYYMKPSNNSLQLTSTTYEKPFSSALYDENIVGVQFHPEKSLKYGITLMSNFLNWRGDDKN